MATKVQQLMKELSSLDRYSKAKGGATFIKKEPNFVEKMDTLFRIFCEDDKQRSYIEKEHLLRMCSKDYDFYCDQKISRIANARQLLKN